MNYLNNKVTGESIVIDKINIESNSIVRSIVNASGIVIASKLPHTFTTISLSDCMTQSVILRDVILNALKEELVMTDFIVEADKQNWLSPNKSMRFNASNADVLEGFKDQTGLATIFNNVLTDAKTDLEIIVIKDSANEIIYVNSISEDNIDVNYYIRTITDENGLIIYNNEAGCIDIEYKLI